MTGELSGTRALITGGGSGIGRASALALAGVGCFVTVVGRAADSLDETVRQVKGPAETGPRCYATWPTRSRSPARPRWWPARDGGSTSG
jgi:NAD(P)-dependent dehydrogenase (short-subunit alcohol dehydrogenase family)